MLADLGRDQNRGRPFKPGSVTATVERWFQTFIDATKKNLDQDGSNASDKLSQSIRFNTKIFGFEYSFLLIMEDYYKFVDEGRKPGKMPPVSEIKKWIIQKGLITRSQSRRSPNIQKEVNSLAFIIARKISKKGKKGTHFYSKVVNQKSLDELKKDVSRALKKDVEIEIMEIKNNIQHN